MRPPQRRLASDRHGSVAILVALGATFLMGAGAVGVDLGLVVYAKRRAQGAVDIAAMLAAADTGRADALARRSLADNGYGSTATVTVAPGSYAGNAKVAPASRFQAGTTPTNAVRVGLRTDVPVHFARLVGLPRSVPVQVTGTAANARFAAFSIGSGTAALDAGIANAVLGAMLGTRISLSVMDYNALLTTRIDTFGVLDALAPSLGLQAATYADIVAANASVGQITAALRVTAQGTPGAGAAAAAVGNLLSALPNAGAMIPVARIADLGDASALSPPRGTAGPQVGLMDLVSGIAAMANGQNQVSIDLGATVPGLLGTRLTLAVGERRQSSSFVQPGTANATISTAQTRLLIETTLTAPLGLGTVSLPIYAEVARASATLRSVACPWTAASMRQVTLDAQPGLLTLAIANVPRSSIAVGAASPDLGRGAPLITLPLLTVQGTARATVASPWAQTLTFSDDDIARHVVRGVSTTGMARSLTGSLIQGMSLSIDGLLPPPLLGPLLSATLSGVAPALDLVLDTTLRTLGIRVGYADVTVDGTLCNQAVLVQ
ncbi:TadG family pilus assembly protein [uncultured Methylobacterium sp.]|uniref:TadG family pilus assembly protein n=1 Tax=uncultured Methylobacterium sp. TaxID=157278 RepID=UPI0035CBC23F